MIHKSISLPAQLWNALKKHSKKIGISMGELVRRIVDEWNDKPDSMK